jgi:hypothetical protein
MKTWKNFWPFMYISSYLIRILKKPDPQKTEKSDPGIRRGSDAGPEHGSTFVNIFVCDVARRAAVRRPRARIAARHPSGGPLSARTTGLVWFV